MAASRKFRLTFDFAATLAPAPGTVSRHGFLALTSRGSMAVRAIDSLLPLLVITTVSRRSTTVAARLRSTGPSTIATSAYHRPGISAHATMHPSTFGSRPICFVCWMKRWRGGLRQPTLAS